MSVKRITGRDGYRWYEAEGKRFISVTAAIGSCPHPMLVNWFKNNSKNKINKVGTETGNIGKRIHDLVEKDLLGVKQTIDSVELKIAFENWLQLKQEMGLKALYTEKMLYSKTYGYAGQMDCYVVDKNGQHYVADIKTGNFSDSAFWQMAAYRQAMFEMGVIEGVDVKLLGIQVHRDGAIAKFHTPDENEDHFLNFLCALHIFKKHNKENLQDWEFLSKNTLKVNKGVKNGLE